MGWNKQASCKSYDSISGHVFYRMPFEKVVAAIVSSKMYTKCSIAESNGEEPPIHIYPRNYDGSSKGMEVDAALHLYKTLYNGNDKNFVSKAIVADDDSSMRVLLRHPDNNPKGNFNWKCRS